MELYKNTWPFFTPVYNNFKFTIIIKAFIFHITTYKVTGKRFQELYKCDRKCENLEISKSKKNAQGTENKTNYEMHFA